MEKEVYAIIHFTDGSKIKPEWPAQGGEDPTTIAMNVRNALEMDKVMAEIDGSLMIVPMQNVKYVVVTPAPPELPKSVLRNAQIIS
jgi:hypothetical protein